MSTNASIRATPVYQPVSARIRARLKAANAPYHANDNIAEYISPEELDELKMEVTQRLSALLDSLVIDIGNDHNTRDTALRVARMYLDEVFSGRYQPVPEVTEFPNVEGLNELIVIGPIAIRSTCAHHLCPIIGKIWIGVLPDAASKLIGLSKYARLSHWVMARPQIQEEAIVRLADLLQERVQPNGLAVVMEAQHFCMHWRGVKDGQSKMTTSVMRGSLLQNEALRREFLGLIKS